MEGLWQLWTGTLIQFINIKIYMCEMCDLLLKAVDILPQKHLVESSIFSFLSGKNKEGDPGNIIYDFEGAIQHISYYTKDVSDQDNLPHFGDKVSLCV